MASLTDRIALITGASRGIGRACANAIGQMGATIIGTATTESGADDISQYFKAEGIRGCGMVLNVTDTSSIDKTVAAITETYGAPHILVNNAGITCDNIMLRMKNDEWDKVIDTDLNSVYYMTKACLKKMVKARWGRIVNVSSVVAAMGNLGQANYSAAKAGMIGFSKSLAYEVAPRNITVNVVAPGFVKTDMTAAIPEAQQEKLCQLIPMARVAEPAEIAAAVAFLVSPDASYITGETIHINGGMYMN